MFRKQSGSVFNQKLLFLTTHRATQTAVKTWEEKNRRGEEYYQFQRLLFKIIGTTILLFINVRLGGSARQAGVHFYAAEPVLLPAQ